MKQNLLYPAIVLALASTPAMGQSDTSTNEIEEIVITGSLIQNPNLTRAAPVAVISEEEMD
ncbi:hypothetical protein N9Z36_02750 [Luminiphilus sp.]|nr:hypothetical protein [Luminiphilus sp.]